MRTTVTRWGGAGVVADAVGGAVIVEAGEERELEEGEAVTGLGCFEQAMRLKKRTKGRTRRYSGIRPLRARCVPRASTVKTLAFCCRPNASPGRVRASFPAHPSPWINEPVRRARRRGGSRRRE